MVEINRLLGSVSKAASRALDTPEVLQMLGTLGIALDEEGVGGQLGRLGKSFVSSRQAGRANAKALQFSEDTLTPPGQPGPRSIKRNTDGSTTLQVDPTRVPATRIPAANTPVQSTDTPQSTMPATPLAMPPRAQIIPDEMILKRGAVPTISPDMRRRVIARARQRGINPITAMNLVTYDLANVNEPHLSRYDPDTAIDYFSELMQSTGDENAALMAYRNSEGQPNPDPDYLGNVTAYTPYSMRAISNEPSAEQIDVSNMIESTTGVSPARLASTPSTPLQNDVATTLQPYLPQRSLTERDFAGLSPDEINQIARVALASRGIDVDIAKTIGETRRAFGKAKVDAAKGIANSGLSQADRGALLDVLRAASTSEEIESIEVATANAPPPSSAGVDRDAVSAELYGERYYDLTRAQQADVNQELNERLAPTAEVVTTEDGVYVVNKRTNRARAVTVAPPSSGEVPPVSQVTPSAPTTPPSAPSSTTVGTSPTNQTGGSLSEFISSVSGDPGIPEPGQPLRGKALNEAQARAYGYGSRALQSEVVLDTLENDPTNRARISTLDSYLKNKIEGLGKNGIVGYASGTLAATSPLVNATVEAVRSGNAAFIDRRYAPIVARQLKNLQSIGKSVSRGVLTGIVVNTITSTLSEPLAQVLRTPEEQQYATAKLDFIASLLRKESGAAITVQEYLDNDRRYFPQVGDKDPVRNQKRANRQQTIRLLQREAGRPLLPPVMGLVAPPPSSSAAKSPVFQPNILGKAFEPYKGQDIVAGKADNMVREFIELRDNEIESLLSKGGIARGKISAIKVRVRRLRAMQESR